MKAAGYEVERTDVANQRITEVIDRSAPASTPHEIPVDWSPQPPGAIAVEVTAAELVVSPATDAVSVPAVTVSPGSNGTFDLSLPTGLRIRSLALSDLGIGSGDAHVALASQSDLTGHDPPLRLTVALLDPRGGFAAPSFAVPKVGGRSGVTPDSLTGASFDGGILTLPEVAASRLRIAVVTGDPGDFTAADDLSLSRVAAETVRYPTGLALGDGAGGTLWSFPKEMPPGSAAQVVDFKMGLKKVLLDKVRASVAPAATLTLTATAASTVSLSRLRIAGALVRAFPGTVRSTLEGNAIALALPPAGEPPLAIDGSASVRADVTVRYDGIRIVSELSDPVPAGASDGVILGAAADGPRARLPPEALRGRRLARLGIVGRAPEECELSVRLVEPATGQPLPGDPAVVRPPPGSAMGVVWFTLPTPSELAQPVAIAARATRGRFFWATRDDGKPLVQIAIEDPDPPERTVSLGGRIIVRDLAPARRAGVDLTACFGTGTPPRFESSLFVTVDLSEVTVRYAR
jgi:hypothetical protein